MSDQRNKGRRNTHDTGAPTARPRDDLRTANKKEKPKEERSEQRDKNESEEKSKESGDE